MKPSAPYRVVVATSDKYRPALRVFLDLFDKYWHDHPPVDIVGFSPPPWPLPSYVSFLSQGKMADYPVERWSNAIIEYLNTLPIDEIIVFMLEDYWITRRVDTVGVYMLAQYMRQFGYVARLDLTTDVLFKDGPRYAQDIPDYGTCGYLDLIKAEPHSPYYLSLLAGLWRAKHLARVMVPDETPWDLEIKGTTRLSEMRDVIVLGTRQWPVRHILAHRGGDTRKVDLSQIPQPDIERLVEKGYLKWKITDTSE